MTRSATLSRALLVLYLLALLLPIYWLVNLSLRSNKDIMSSMRFWPHHPSLVKYAAILQDPT